MSDTVTRRSAEVDEQNKIVSLFRFVEELNRLKQKAVLNIVDYPWSYMLSKLPDDQDNIILNYRDRVEDEEPNASSTILSVRKPEFKKCPEPDAVFKKWLEAGWDQYTNQKVHTKDTLDTEEHKRWLQRNLFVNNNNDDTEPEHFNDNEDRVKTYETWLERREAWAAKQRTIAQIRDLFNDLYRLYFELQRETETEELVVANGMLRDSRDLSIQHPVLTHRVKLDYNPERNEVSIEDTNAPSELYSVLFQMMQDINLSSIKHLNEDLQTNDYHPLDRNDTPDFMKVLVHQLSSESIFSKDGIPENWKDSCRLLLSFEPCFIVRRRLDGTPKAIEQIIENVQETGEIPAPIHDIISGGTIEIPEDPGGESLEEQLAAVGGESVDILLSKEANKEQLEIARRIERYNAVIVQGPPGTGKTHTIANLMGHFLAQGKSVLVTSYTKKALSVLKEKVAPGLQNLCVSILDDSNADMERSIDGITDYMSRTTSFEIKKQMDLLATERRDIVNQMAAVRRNIFSIIHQEYESIILNGEGVSPSNAAAFVSDHQEDLSYIPGTVRLRAPLPLTFEQLNDLYKSNEGISGADENELKFDIPNPAQILSVAEFEQACVAIHSANGKIANVEKEKDWRINYSFEENRIEIKGDFGSISFPLPDEGNLQKLNDYVVSCGHIEQWMRCAAVDGRNDNAYRQRWVTLMDQIWNTQKFAESILTEQFGRTIDLPTEDTETLQSVFERIRGSMSSKGKIPKLTLMLNKDYEPALERVRIDGHAIQSKEECDIIIHCFMLNNYREQCARYWDELLKPNGLPTFFSLDSDAPEKVASNWLPMIYRYLDWYRKDYQYLVSLLRSVKLPVDVLFSKNPLDSDLVSTGKILDSIDHIIPSICAVVFSALAIQEQYSRILETRKILISGQRSFSPTCHKVVQMLDARNVSGYADAFLSLESLYEKYDLQRKRSDLLSILEPFAPQWAEAIRTRAGIHGRSTVPDTIEDAWKWKQLCGIITEITGKPFEELQEESFRLSKEYRRITAAYAEKCGWFHLLRRTEADIDTKQALQGWKQTVKRIGKGTGKNAPALKAKARELMTKCQSAVPGWIMPINRALESLNPKSNRFDIIIIDEASQADISSLAILYMGKKLIIVGDDKQVSPMAVGVEVDKMNALEQMYIKDKIPNSHLYNAKTSIYDIAATTFQPLMLREHFRCVPEIIGFSNMLSYDFRIKPLRDASNSVLLPAVVNYRVADGHRENNKTNPNEAKAIVALMQACIQQPEYDGKSFGVISLLGDEQARLIQRLIEQRIDPKEMISRNILCGNSANFQGDERDVVFLSVVDSGNGNGPLNMMNYGADDAYRKRYNVAASRAKDQLWVVDSLDPACDLKTGDIRKMLIDYSINPQAIIQQGGRIEEQAESPFEEAVAKALTSRGYHLIQQWKVGAYRIDIVAVCGKKTVAIECDGERWHSGEAKIREDMERQTILERLGWRFIRIRGSEFYRDTEKTIDRVVSELEKYGITPEPSIPAAEEGRDTELLRRVKKHAELILMDEANNPLPYYPPLIEPLLNPVPTFPDGNGVPLPRPRTAPEPERKPKSPAVPIFDPVPTFPTGIRDPLPHPRPNPEPERKPKTPVIGTRTPDKGVHDSKASSVIALLKKNGIKYIDNRSVGGNFWIVGGPELRPLIEECREFGVYFSYKEKGGKATKHEPAWLGSL